MSALPTTAAASSRPNLPPNMVTHTSPSPPSRSPSFASTGGETSGADDSRTRAGEQIEERQTPDADSDDDDESDFHAEGDPDDPEASTVALSRLGPALATPKQTSTSSPWPFTATPSAEATTKPASDATAAAVAVSPTMGTQAVPGNASQGSTTASGPSSTPGAAADAAMLLSPSSSSAGGAAIPASALPHEILLHILRLLPPTSLAPALRVCKAWCQCGVELLWYKPTFTSLPSLYKMLQVLSLPDQTFPYPDFVRRLNFLPLAKEMSDRLVAKILPCTRLERITLTNCKALSSPAIAALLIRSHRLIALDLTDVESVDDEVLIALAEHCPRLQGLNLSGCVRVTDRGLEALALKATGMRRIKLRKCDQLTDVPIMLLSIHCPLLLEIDLAFCTSVSQHAIMQLFRTSTCLREISLPGCTGLTDEGFPDANELQLVSAFDTVHHHQNGGAGSYPHSGYASPSYPYHLNGGGSSAASSAPGTPGSGTEPLVSTSGFSLPRPQPIRSPPAYKPFDQLRYIDVTSCGSLTDAAVAGLAKYCPKLRNLMLGKCTRLTDDALFAICGIGKHLHYLHLGHVHNITDRAVTAIARACTRLRYIDLANCINLTDQSVIELANNLPRLKRIGLVRVNNITDAAIEALSQRTSLERIHLSYCDNLTVSAISSMLQELPRVTHLSLTGVSSFRKRLLQQFCRAPPSSFNDHQRRSFCVFSGRGVVELRKFLRNLTPTELNALAMPDPPSEDDPPNFGRHTNAMLNAAAAVNAGTRHGGGGNVVRGNGALQQVPVGQTAAQFAATQARLAQIQQARQTLAIAHQRLQAHQAATAAAAAAAAATQQQPPPPPQARTNGLAPNPYAMPHGAAAGQNMLGLDLPPGGQQGSTMTTADWSMNGAASAGSSVAVDTAARMPSAGSRRPGQLSSSQTSSQSSEDETTGMDDPMTVTAAGPRGSATAAATHNSAPASYAALWSSPTVDASTPGYSPALYQQFLQQQREQQQQHGDSSRSSGSVSRSRSPSRTGMDLDERVAEDNGGPYENDDDGPEGTAPWRARRRSTITRQSYLAERRQVAGAGSMTNNRQRQRQSSDGSEEDENEEGEEEDISMGDA